MLVPKFQLPMTDEEFERHREDFRKKTEEMAAATEVYRAEVSAAQEAEARELAAQMEQLERLSAEEREWNREAIALVSGNGTKTLATLSEWLSDIHRRRKDVYAEILRIRDRAFACLDAAGKRLSQV